MRVKYLLTSALIVAAIPATPAQAILGVEAGPEVIAASALLYNICKQEGGKGCWLLALDPPSSEVVFIDLTFSFDPNKIEINPDGLYFGDYSASGVQIPLQPPVYGSVQPVLPNPGVDLDLAGSPRTGTTSTFTVDNVLGTAGLLFDLSGNPTPSGAPAQNFFGYRFISKLGPITGIQYFNTPGNYDVTVTGWTCRTVEGLRCGSSTPVFGFNLSVPEPATWALSIFGFGLAGWALRRRSRVTTSFA